MKHNIILFCVPVPVSVCYYCSTCEGKTEEDNIIFNTVILLFINLSTPISVNVQCAVVQQTGAVTQLEHRSRLGFDGRGIQMCYSGMN